MLPEGCQFLKGPGHGKYLIWNWGGGKCNLCSLKRAYNQFFGGKKSFFPRCGKDKATLHRMVAWGIISLSPSPSRSRWIRLDVTR